MVFFYIPDGVFCPWEWFLFVPDGVSLSLGGFSGPPTRPLLTSRPTRPADRLINQMVDHQMTTKMATVTKTVKKNMKMMMKTHKK